MNIFDLIFCNHPFLYFAMLASRPLQTIRSLFAITMAALLIASCGVVPKDYPRDKPFVYKTNINLEGKFSKDEKDALESQLKNQLDDSMRTETVYKLFYQGFNRSVLVKPPVFDSANAERSITFMKALMNKLGYLRNKISFDTTLLVKEEANPPQYRTTVNFTVKAGPRFLLDSISHVINNYELQALTDASKENTLLHKGDPFSQQLVSEELNRLVDLYRENGYLRFSFEDLAGVWDTLNLAVLRPSFDPFEQIRLLEELKRRRDSPSTDIEIRLRPGYEIDHLKKYFVGHTTIYPDFNVADTISSPSVRTLYDNNFTFVTYHNLFKKKFITQNIYFRRGDLYNEKRFFKTINRFNTLGAWRLVNIEQIPRAGTDTVDFDVFLTPAYKYNFSTNIEGSRNSSFLLDERLLGVGLNMQLINRNFGRSSNLSSANIRFGTEVDTKGSFVKTKQASIGYTINFPKPIPNSKFIKEKFRDNFRSVLNFSLGNIDRQNLFNVTSLNASWGYLFNWKNRKGRTIAASLRIPNIEYVNLNPRQELEDIFVQNPSLRYIFNTGLVASIQAGLELRGGKGRSTNIFRTNIEESGTLTNLIRAKAFDSLFHFLKLDAEFIRHITYGKKSLVLRTYTGAGFAFETRNRKGNVYLPFFKQFYAGGPNSMRAWRVRTLGPGSSLFNDSIPFRFGDFQFEANVEYRFPLFKIGGYPVSSCLFTDIGNVWFLQENTDFPNGTLRADNFLKDLAVGIGTGLRFDFDFFRIRFDYAFKVRNPSPDPSNIGSQFKWFDNINLLDGTIQIGINYPFAF